MSKRNLYMIITGLILFNAIVLIRFLAINNSLEDLKLENENVLRIRKESYGQEADQVKKLIMDDFDLRLNSEVKIDKNMILSNSEGSNIQLVDLIENNGPMLVYFFKNRGCETCYLREIENIKKYGDNYEKYKYNLVVMSKFNTPKNQKIMENQFNNVDLYHVGDNSLGTKLEEIDEPFYFLLDIDYNLKHIYRPLNFLPEKSDNYFEFFKK